MRITLEKSYDNNIKINSYDEADNSSIILYLRDGLTREPEMRDIKELANILNYSNVSVFIGLRFGNIEIFYDYSNIDNNFKMNLLSHVYEGNMIFKIDKCNSKDIQYKLNILLNLMTTLFNNTFTKNQNLFDEIIKRSENNYKSSKEDINIGLFRRDMILVESLKEYFEYKCIICSNNIKRDHDKPYVESHHFKMLSEGGVDSADNIAIVCPNCHKEFHFGKMSKRVELIKIFNQKNPFINKINGVIMKKMVA